MYIIQDWFQVLILPNSRDAASAFGRKENHRFAGKSKTPDNVWQFITASEIVLEL